MPRGNYIPEPYATRRREALAAGAKKYEGRPCKRGHTLRYTNEGGCIQCQLDSYARNKRLISARNKLKHALDGRKRMLAAAKCRANKRGLAFDLELEDIEIPEVCPVLGIDMDRPSLDRVNNDLGYVRSNVRVISTRANTLKNDATIEELEAVLAYMRSFTNTEVKA